MKYFESKYVTVSWQESQQCIHTVWHGYVPSAEFRKGLLKGIELGIKVHAKRWLSDLRDMHIISIEDQKWIETTFYPRMLLVGIRKLAFLKPTLPVTLMSVQRVIKKYDNKRLETAFFAEAGQAYAWFGGMLNLRSPSKR
ncbi:MAG: hypothetical protein Q8K75_03565 [Chlamydiales bacterium]|nr:hypothetical protein [Chlamydiales bacterium]